MKVQLVGSVEMLQGATISTLATQSIVHLLRLVGLAHTIVTPQSGNCQSTALLREKTGVRAALIQ